MTRRDGAPRQKRGSRRSEILEIAVALFAAKGFHGVSMDEIGAAAGVTGPALYHHFAGKEAMLAAALGPASEQCLADGRARVAAFPDRPRQALAALVAYHVDLALSRPEVIALQLHELDRLPEETRRSIRRLQRMYVEEWVTLLVRIRPEVPAAEARVLAHAAFGLMNSTPFLGEEVDRERTAALLNRAALAVLLDGVPPED